MGAPAKAQRGLGKSLPGMPASVRLSGGAADGGVKNKDIERRWGTNLRDTSHWLRNFA